MDAGDWDRRYAESGLVWSATPNRFVERELSDLPAGSALDLGTGEGRNALWLAGRGWQVTAVDFSRVALDKARELLASRPDRTRLRVEWVHADAATYDSGGERFDLVVLAYLQLPAAQRRIVVRRAFGALAEFGTFFLVAHDSTNLAEGTGGPQDPQVLYTADDVLADLDGMRWDTLRAERVERVVEPSADHGGERSRIAYDCLVRLRRLPAG